MHIKYLWPINTCEQIFNIVSLAQVHGLLHLLGFDHEISEEAESEMEEEEEFLLKSLGWKGKGLIQSASNAEATANLHVENFDGNWTFILFIINCCF